MIWSILPLFSPLIWELYNDRNGDVHISRGPLELPSKKVDVAVRVLFASLAAILNLFVFGIPIFKSVFLCASIHFFFFDYIIAYILLKRGIIQGHWFSYMGSKGMDNVKSWKNLHPFIKLVIRLIVLVIAVSIYIN